jgi:hypothetical protein
MDTVNAKMRWIFHLIFNTEPHSDPALLIASNESLILLSTLFIFKIAVVDLVNNIHSFI